MAIAVLYDGWTLARQPDSPGALHLLALLAYCPPQVQALVALPGAARFPLPAGIDSLQSAAADSSLGRLKWEQQALPGLARHAGASLVHLMSANPPLFGPRLSVISPAEYGANPWAPKPAGERSGTAARMREALSQGSLARARGLLWPSNLPAPQATGAPLLELPPLVHPAFDAARLPPSSSRDLELPGTYILYHGPCALQDLRRVLDAWSWAAGSIGDYYPLLLAGLDAAAQARLPGLVAEYELEGMVRPLQALPPEDLAAVYLGCSALLHPAPVSPWSDPLALALACGRPVVALESKISDALVGPAAYLVPSGRPPAAGPEQAPDSGIGIVSDASAARSLGAALITVVVEESLAAGMSEAAYRRAAAWRIPDFSERLMGAYERMLSR